MVIMQLDNLAGVLRKIEAVWQAVRMSTMTRGYSESFELRPVKKRSCSPYPFRQPAQCLKIGIFESALPNPEHSPASFMQVFFNQFITSGIGHKFLPPEFGIAFGGCSKAAARMAMPKTAMNENAEPVAGKNEIRFAGKFFDMHSKTKSQSMKISAQCQFRACVFAFDASHHG